MRPALPLLLASTFAALPAAAQRPTFADVTAQAGLGYVQHAAEEPPGCLFFGGRFCEPERMSGGAAVGDVDGDGWPDLFVTRLDAPDLLFRNLGDGRFEEIGAAAGLAAFDLQSNGAAFADVDADGDLDLYVTGLGEAGDPVNARNHLFVNDGRGVFSEDAVARGAAIASGARRIGFGVAVGDYDRDGHVDLHTTEWQPFGVSHARLLRNRGAAAPGHFEDVTESAGVNLQASDGFASTFTDLDGDGWPDLAVAADFGTSRLFWNAGDGSFVEGTAGAGIGTDENGMGSTFGDVDGDGDLDWFVTSIFDPDETCDTVPCNWGHTGNRLYRYEGGRLFTDATDEAGVRDGAWGWGAVFFDYDNDGDLDLVMTNGVDFPGSAVEDAFNADVMRFWENDGSGVMSEVSTGVGVTDTGSGKGLLVFDYDRDGDLDLFVVNNAGQPRLYRNDGGNRRRWLRVELRGTRSNPRGLGARIEVQGRRWTRPQIREVGTAGHFLGQSEVTAHFGLGRSRRPVQVTVHWPSGAVQELRRVRLDRTLVVVESARACGLLGVEPLVVLGGLLRWRGRRRARLPT